MRLNNKGFALTSIIYMLIVLFLLLLLLILSNLASRKVVLDKLKYDVKNKFNQGGVVAPLGRTIGEIISFDLTDSGDGLYSFNDKYIYKGSNPNNYIWLDENGNNIPEFDEGYNEMYRIISFESDGSIKVIRDNKIGDYAWDINVDSTDLSGNLLIPRNVSLENSYCIYDGTYYGCNAWGNQGNTYFDGSLLENDFYYMFYNDNSTSNLTKNIDSKGVVDDSSLNSYLNNNWLTGTGLLNYIDKHNFNVSGVMYSSSYVGGDKGIVKEMYEESLNTWNGYIGLFNITDLVNSSTNIGCSSVYSNFYYNTSYFYESDGSLKQNNNSWSCSQDNWLFKGINEWTLSPNSMSSDSVWFVSDSSYFSYLNAYELSSVRPSFYLKPDFILSGTGSLDDYYKIILD